jgi:hypothetical protein
MFTKLMPLHVGGDPNGLPVQLIIETGFAYDADKSIANAAAWKTRTVPALTT